MYCPRCGALNPDDSAFCGVCGTSLALPPQPVQPLPSPGAPPTSPFLTAVLNFFFGLGYIYLRYRRILGLQPVLFVFAMIAAYFIMGVITDGVLSLGLALLLASDGYLKGKGQKGFIGAE